MTSNKFIRFLTFFSIVMALVACSDDNDVPQETTTLKGHVLHGELPVEKSMVTLYRAGSTRGSTGVALGTAQTDSAGTFELSYFSPGDPHAVLYLTAAGPPGSVKLVSVLGVPPVPSEIVINERTTIATAYAMAQFIVGGGIGGTYPGLQNAAATLQNLVNIHNGNLAQVLSRFPNGLFTSTLSQFNSLANLIASCVEDSTACSPLFAQSTPPGGATPTNTFQAAVNIAHFPWQNVDALFGLSQSSNTYQPALQDTPNAWALAIRYGGNGQELDGPGNIAFDADGNAWVANNYTYSPNPLDPNVCGDDHLLKLTPTGEDFPGAPYQGGGLYGAGFGITLDRDGNVWIGNFGFAGSECPIPPGGKTNQSLLWNSVSKFSSAGVAISPDGDLGVDPVIPGGYLSDEDARPQGMVSDKKGNVWVANCDSASVTKFVKGDPNQRVVYNNFGVDKPFDIAIDPWGNAWVTSNNNHSVYRIDPDGNTEFMGDTVFQRPMGIAGDSQGNMWVSNSGGLDPPCGDQTVQDIIDFLAGISENAPVPGASVTMIMPDGTPSAGSPYTGGGLYMPWGIAVDGNDNVFVANFNGKRLSYLCGANPSNCPPGFNTGDPISPDDGYTFDGLVRNTGVQIDPSGNVWLANNWEIDPFPTNPGGHQLVVFIGLAAPVKTPLIGPPERP